MCVCVCVCVCVLRRIITGVAGCLSIAILSQKLEVILLPRFSVYKKNVIFEAGYQERVKQTDHWTDRFHLPDII